MTIDFGGFHRPANPFDAVQAAAQRRAAARASIPPMTEDQIVSAFDAMPPNAAIALAERMIRYAIARKEPSK